MELAVTRIEPLGEDETRCGCRRGRAEAALLDGDDDHDRTRLVLHKTRVPGLIGVESALGRAGLAVDRIVLLVPALEDVRRRTVGRGDGLVQTFEPDLPIALVELDVALGLRAELLHRDA